MKHNDGLPEIANTLIWAGCPNKCRKLAITKFQHAMHKITINRQMERQTNRQTDMVSAHTKLLKRQTDTKKTKRTRFF